MCPDKRAHVQSTCLPHTRDENHSLPCGVPAGPQPRPPTPHQPAAPLRLCLPPAGAPVSPSRVTWGAGAHSHPHSTPVGPAAAHLRSALKCFSQAASEQTRAPRRLPPAPHPRRERPARCPGASGTPGAHAWPVRCCGCTDLPVPTTGPGDSDGFQSPLFTHRPESVMGQEARGAGPPPGRGCLQEKPAAWPGAGARGSPEQPAQWCLLPEHQAASAEGPEEWGRGRTQRRGGGSMSPAAGESRVGLPDTLRPPTKTMETPTGWAQGNARPQGCGGEGTGLWGEGTGL